MQDFTHIGLDEKLRAKTSLSNRHPRISAVDMDAYYDIRTNFIDASKADLGELVKRASGDIAYGTFTTSQAFTLESAITYKSPHSIVKTFGKPIIGIYQGAGTLQANMIYPVRGGSVTLGRYDVIGGELDYNDYNGTADQWRGVLVDTNGTSAQVFSFVVDWLFVDYRSNTVS